MKKLLALSFVIIFGLTQTTLAQIWIEDFSNPANDGKGGFGEVDATNTVDLVGVTNWGVDISGADMTSTEDWFYQTNGLFQGRDIGGEGIWTSKVVDISLYATASFSIEAIGYGGLEAGDYFDVAYEVDGGGYTTVTNWEGLGDGTHTFLDDFTMQTVAVYNIAGNTLGIRVTALNGAGAEFHQFDNVIVSTNEPPTDVPPEQEPIGNQSTTISNALNFDVIAQDDVDGDDITMWATDLPAGATYASNTVSGGIMTNSFSWATPEPVGVYTTTFWAADKDGSVSETVEITVNPSVDVQLFISEVADPGDVYQARFVELYNAGASAIDFDAETFYISRQVNGGSTWDEAQLTGTVAAGQTYVIANDPASFTTSYGQEPDFDMPGSGGNGDDAYMLYANGDHTLGTLVDIYGVIDESGSGQAWDYENSRAERTNTVTGPNTTWTASEWTITSADVADMTPGVHGDTSALPDVTVTNPSGTSASVGTETTSYDVSGTANTNVVGEISWTNSLTEVGGTIAAATNWTISGIALNIGANVITVTGTNDSDFSDSEIITISRASPPDDVWINEIGYDSVGTDTNEWVELAGKAGVSLDAYELVMINQDGSEYNTFVFTNASFTFSDESDGYGFFVIGITAPTLGVPADYEPVDWTANEIQNGGADSIQLRKTNGPVNAHLVDYEGNNPNTADDQSTDLADLGGDDDTIFLTGGPGTNYTFFSWTNTVASATPGALNVAQSFFTGGGFVDTDVDGMDDNWETLHFTNLTATGVGSNFDGDATSDLEEYIADTDPHDAASFFDNIVTSAMGYVTMDLIAGPPTTNSRIYDAYSTTDLVSGVWGAYGLRVRGADNGSAVTLTVTNDVPGRYYRTGVYVP